MNVKLRSVCAVAAIALLAACATHPLTPGEHLTVVPDGILPPPDVVDDLGRMAIRVGPYDRLAIVVMGVPELTQVVRIDGNGRFELPLVGSVDADGKTPALISEEIAQRLRGTYVRDPRVSVNVDEIVSQTVTVDGQVREPGLYPVPGRMSLSRAIASARGVTELARLQDVVVFRTVEGRQMAALYNLQAIRRGLYEDPEIYANDVIVVGDSPARRLFQQFLQVSPLLSAPIIAILDRN